MLAAAFRFPAGSYHATPWGRHVNEADVAWPPDFFRLSRALIATWYRKLRHGEFPLESLELLLAELAAETPHYQLPSGVHTHTRHYMPVREGSKEKKALIFDAFVRIARGDALIMAWPTLELEDELLELFDVLLERLGYLGRTESWVEARRLDDWHGEFNCYPSEVNVDLETGEVLGDIVPLLLPRTPEDYKEFRSQSLKQAEERKMKSRERKKMKDSLPEDWLDAIGVDTSAIQAAGWSAPPAALKVEYLRPLNALKTNVPPRPVTIESPQFTTVRYALYGKPLPRIEDSVRIGEWLRQAVMGKARRLYGEEGIPSVLSGHELGEKNKHGHAFYLPEDADGDGLLDHLVIHIPNGMDDESRQVLARITRLWRQNGDELQLLLENMGNAEDFESASLLFKKSDTFAATTPYLHPWYAKKKLTVADQIRRECAIRGLPEVKQAEQIETIKVGGRGRRPLHFHRFRSKRGLEQPDRQGSFWRLTFAEPIRGPLALGFGCHFGLGLFGAEIT